MFDPYMIFLLAAMLTAAPLHAVVMDVNDGGSTIRVSPFGKPTMDHLIYKLAGVMAPQGFQHRSGETARWMLDFALGEEVSVEIVKVAKDDVQARVEEGDPEARFARIRKGNVWLHEAIVEAGMAWVTPNGRRDAKLTKLEDAAKAAKRGVWQDTDPLPPWEWRELLLLVETATKRVHSGWDCPWVQQTQCKPSCDRAYDLTGLTPHEECFDAQKLRIARASGFISDDDPPDEDRRPHLKPAPRRTCKVDADCGFAPPAPCSCFPCGGYWRTPVRKDVAARMKKNYARGQCMPAGCAACAGWELGKRAFCKDAQCQVE
jgi:hypothetical protein